MLEKIVLAGEKFILPREIPSDFISSSILEKCLAKSKDIGNWTRSENFDIGFCVISGAKNGY